MTSILFVKTEKGQTKCSFGHDGKFLIVSPFSVKSSDEQRLILENMDRFLNDFFSVSYAEKAEEGYYFRFTSDKNEFQKIQDGKYTQSVNHQDNRLERGISVSLDMSYCALGAYDFFYKVSGKVIGYGSDGEPLLDASTMQKHSPYKSIACYCKKASKKQAEKEAEFLKKYNWTIEQLTDLRYESICHSCKKQYIDINGEIVNYSPWGGCTQKIFKEDNVCLYTKLMF